MLLHWIALTLAVLPPASANLHTVFTTECTPYFTWQSLGQHLTPPDVLFDGFRAVPAPACRLAGHIPCLLVTSTIRICRLHAVLEAVSPAGERDAPGELHGGGPKTLEGRRDHAHSHGTVLDGPSPHRRCLQVVHTPSVCGAAAIAMTQC